jgi:hypothetical protein
MKKIKRLVFVVDPYIEVALCLCASFWFNHLFFNNLLWLFLRKHDRAVKKQMFY